MVEYFWSGSVLTISTLADEIFTPLTPGVTVTVSISVPAVTVTSYTPALFLVRDDNAALFSGPVPSVISETATSTGLFCPSFRDRVSTCALFPSAGS
ncbi:hypothetical protein D3C73_1481730 [compost metagenome]